MKTLCIALALFYPDDDGFLSIRASCLVSIGLLLCDGVCIAACVALNRALYSGLSQSNNIARDIVHVM